MRDGAHAREDHVADLLVGVEARGRGQGLADDGGRVGDAGRGQGRGREPDAFLEERDGGEEQEGEDGDDGEEVDVVLFVFCCCCFDFVALLLFLEERRGRSAKRGNRWVSETRAFRKMGEIFSANENNLGRKKKKEEEEKKNAPARPWPGP